MNLPTQSLIETPLGPLIATGDEEALYRLEFADSLESSFPFGSTRVLQMIEEELNSYFAGTLKEFQTPLSPFGTPFQKRVWEELKRIPYGKTISYRELATAIGKPTAYRAAAQANGRNPFVIVVPCHRVINTGGGLGGYNCGLDRKKWLLQHEKF